jgi:hypothetical protein
VAGETRNALHSAGFKMGKMKLLILLSSLLQVGIGIGATLLALGFVGQLAKKALEDVDKTPDGP